MKQAIWLLLGVWLAGCPSKTAPNALGEPGCSKDTDCKADRLCIQRVCQAPPEGEARPAKWQPAPLDSDPGPAATGERFVTTGGAAMASSTVEALEGKLLARLNEARASKGLGPLVSDPKLLEAARSHSEEMAKLGYFSHSSPTAGRETFFDRIVLAGAAGVSSAGENIAYRDGAMDDEALAEALAQQWLESPPHRANLLSPEYRVTGLGLYRAGTRVWATQVFADRVAK